MFDSFFTCTVIRLDSLIEFLSDLTLPDPEAIQKMRDRGKDGNRERLAAGQKGVTKPLPPSPLASRVGTPETNLVLTSHAIAEGL